MFILYPGFLFPSRIPNRWVKKAPDPGPNPQHNFFFYKASWYYRSIYFISNFVGLDPNPIHCQKARIETQTMTQVASDLRVGFSKFNLFISVVVICSFRCFCSIPCLGPGCGGRPTEQAGQHGGSEQRIHPVPPRTRQEKVSRQKQVSDPAVLRIRDPVPF